jgi:hypothetical protein
MCGFPALVALEGTVGISDRVDARLCTRLSLVQGTVTWPARPNMPNLRAELVEKGHLTFHHEGHDGCP